MQELSLPSYDFLVRMLERYRQNAHVPFTNTPESALLVLSDGQWVPGVRVESASYSLTIPALLNAYSTAYAFGRTDIALVCMNRSFREEELTYIRSTSQQDIQRLADGILQLSENPLPRLIEGTPLPAHLDEPLPASPDEGIALARTLTHLSYVPESNFPVASVLETSDGLLIPGINVEHSDWLYILCAERNALGTAISYGHRSINTVYLTCSKDTQCSPCGACRQLLAELTPDAVLWMDRGSTLRETATPETLLPSWFQGRTLINKLSDC